MAWPERWLWTQWPFANHWAVQGLARVLAGEREQLALHVGLCLATGLPLLLLTAWLLRARLGFASKSAYAPGERRMSR